MIGILDMRLSYMHIKLQFLTLSCQVLNSRDEVVTSVKSVVMGTSINFRQILTIRDR